MDLSIFLDRSSYAFALTTTAAGWALGKGISGVLAGKKAYKFVDSQKETMRQSQAINEHYHQYTDKTKGFVDEYYKAAATDAKNVTTDMKRYAFAQANQQLSYQRHARTVDAIYRAGYRIARLFLQTYGRGLEGFLAFVGTVGGIWIVKKAREAENAKSNNEQGNQ